MTDLWPDSIDFPKINPPVNILREQAMALSDKTDNLVNAIVKKAERSFDFQYLPGADNFIFDFFIVAPTFDNFHYKLLSISYDVSFYPVSINAGEDITNEILFEHSEGKLKAKSEDEFLSILRELFNANKTIEIIQALMSQARYETGLAPELFGRED